jgi:hypothetical protein
MAAGEPRTVRIYVLRSGRMESGGLTLAEPGRYPGCRTHDAEAVVAETTADILNDFHWNVVAGLAPDAARGCPGCIGAAYFPSGGKP